MFRIKKRGGVKMELKDLSIMVNGTVVDADYIERETGEVVDSDFDLASFLEVVVEVIQSKGIEDDRRISVYLQKSG